MMSEGYRLFVGIDWGAESHQVSVCDDAGATVDECRVAHTGDALRALVARVIALAQEDVGAIAVALEMPHGPIVEAFLERGCHVFAINPKQLDRFRDRFTVAGAKDDRRDAHVLARSLRTDLDAFRRIQADDPALLLLREYSRHDSEIAEDFLRLANRLREHLQRVWPELLALVPAADEPWLWTLLEWARTPAAAAAVRPARVRQLLREHRIRRLAAEDVLTVLRTTSVPLAAGIRGGVQVRVVDLIEQLRVLHAQRRRAMHRLQEALAAITDGAEITREQHDATILQSLPGIGTRIAATLLAEAAQPLRARDYHAQRLLTGIAPVTHQSGKSRVVSMRYACHGRLRNAVYMWALGSLRRDPRSKALYTRCRQRGHTHARALRGVADRLLALLMTLLRTRTCFDLQRWHPSPQAA
jgi:transposase